VKPSEREHRGIPLQLDETVGRSVACGLRGSVEIAKSLWRVGDGQESPSTQIRARSRGRPSFYAVTTSSSPSAPPKLEGGAAAIKLLGRFPTTEVQKPRVDVRAIPE
jgi:hypothetical protein